MTYCRTTPWDVAQNVAPTSQNQLRQAGLSDAIRSAIVVLN